MDIRRTFKVSLSALFRNKMRSFLTMLGIIIGVAAVISMTSIGQGAKVSIIKRFQSLGTDLLVISPGSRTRVGVSSGAGTGATGGYNNLKEDDAAAVASQCDAVKSVSPSVSSRAQVVYGNKNWNTSIQGAGESYPQIRNWVVEGIFFDESMVKSGQKVCVLGQTTKENLFADEDPIGKIIRIKKIPFKVIGVLKTKGEAGGWFNQDDMIVAPYTTVMRRLSGVDYVNSIDVSAVPMSSAEAKKQIEELLRIRHRIAPGAADDFTVRDMAEIAAGAQESTRILTILLGSIAAISLLVGGIGIMNIMLVSVTERIREIGIRMAIGAREKDILIQFLTESIIMCLVGGLIGVGVGIIGAKLLHLIPTFSQHETVITFNSIILAFGFATLVGIFFGFYPARKASRLDPIQALRYE